MVSVESVGTYHFFIPGRSCPSPWPSVQRSCGSGSCAWTCRHTRTYLAPVAAALVLTALLVGRLVTNAIRLRAAYHKAIAATATTWDPDEARKWPPDPTIPFIGENWWKLPATFAAIAFALWQILEWTGAAHAIAAAAGT